MRRAQMNPLNAEDGDPDAAAGNMAEDLVDLRTLVDYVRRLESKDKTLRGYTHSDFVRALFLSGSAADRRVFKAIADGT